MKYIVAIIIVIILVFLGYFVWGALKTQKLPTIVETGATNTIAPSTPDNSVENPVVGGYKAPKLNKQ